MKIIKRLRDLHEEATEKYGRLGEEVRSLLKPKVEDLSWFFIDRLKGLESFALKIETGRVLVPIEMEDFFACTIVVPTVAKIDDAEALVCSLYDLKERRPPLKGQTHKTSSDFVFDDLRLYVGRRPLSSGKHPDLDGVLFEVQIKTILQYAWGISTHDLIYKSDVISWPRERIAFQVKAMLEHAELVISDVTRIADAPFVAKQDSRTRDILKIMEQSHQFWEAEKLPLDVKRFAETIYEIFSLCRIPIEQLSGVLEFEKNRCGLIPVDLSPYGFLVQALANNPTIHFENGFRNSRVRLVIHQGMDVPEWLKQPNPRILVLD